METDSSRVRVENATLRTNLAFAALTALLLILLLVQCVGAPSSPEEWANDTGEPVGIMFFCGLFIVSIVVPNIAFEPLAPSLERRGGFNAFKFLVWVATGVAILTVCLSIALTLLFKLPASSYPNVLGYCTIVLSVVFFPFAVLWAWFAKCGLTSQST